MTKEHEEKETLVVEVEIPEHADRVTTPLFTRTRKLLLAAGARCWICGRIHTSEDPLEAHHHPIERCFAEEIDWELFKKDAQAGEWGPKIQAFDWDHFDPKDPYTFVDDMTVNGMLICKAHHTGKDEGIHMLPFPIWVAQKYAKEGSKFSDVEIIHHAT